MSAWHLHIFVISLHILHIFLHIFDIFLHIFHIFVSFIFIASRNPGLGRHQVGVWGGRTRESWIYPSDPGQKIFQSSPDIFLNVTSSGGGKGVYLRILKLPRRGIKHETCQNNTQFCSLWQKIDQSEKRIPLIEFGWLFVKNCQYIINQFCRKITENGKSDKN